MHEKALVFKTLKLVSGLVALLAVCLPLSAIAAPACPATMKGPAAVAGIGGATYWTDGTLVSSSVNQGSDISLCRYQGTKVTTTPAGTTSEPYSYDKIVKSLTAVLLRPKMSYVVLLFDASFRFRCNGVAITPDWILTTRRCVELNPQDSGTGALNGGLALGGGDITVNLFHDAALIDGIDKHPSADLAMVHLSTPLVLRNYAQITRQSPPSSGTLYTWMCESANDCPLGNSVMRSSSVGSVIESAQCSSRIYYVPGKALCGHVDAPLADNGGTGLVTGNEGSPLVKDGAVVGLYSISALINGGPTLWHTSYWHVGDASFSDLYLSKNFNWVTGYQGIWSWFPGW